MTNSLWSWLLGFRAEQRHASVAKETKNLTAPAASDNASFNFEIDLRAVVQMANCMNRSSSPEQNHLVHAAQICVNQSPSSRRLISFVSNGLIILVAILVSHSLSTVARFRQDWPQRPSWITCQKTELVFANINGLIVG